MGSQVAVKLLQNGKKNSHVLSAADTVKILDNPNVIQLFQVMETVEHVYLVMESLRPADCRRRGLITCQAQRSKVRQLSARFQKQHQSC
jgi:hypothetical protein